MSGKRYGGLYKAPTKEKEESERLRGERDTPKMLLPQWSLQNFLIRPRAK